MSRPVTAMLAGGSLQAQTVDPEARLRELWLTLPAVGAPARGAVR